MSGQLTGPRQQTGAERSGAFRFALLAAIALVCVYLFSLTLQDLVLRWNEEEYSHGFLIPVVTMWLLWARRDALRASFGPPSWSGPIIVLIAMIMHVLGELSGIYILSQFAIVITLLGVMAGIGGLSLLKVSLVPIAFLAFAIPPPSSIESALTLNLQLISSELGTSFIRLFSIPVYLDGNIIDLGVQKLQVAEACSGLRYVFPLLGLGFLAAYLFHAQPWKRTIVFLSTIPISIAMNSFRIGLVGVTVAYWGPQMADEVLHAFEGWVVFLACLGLLAGEIYLFAYFSGKSFGEVFYLPSVRGPSVGGPTVRDEGRTAGQIPLIASLSVLCISGLAVHFILARPEAAPTRPRFASFPTQIGQWQGHTSPLDPPTEDVVRVLDDYILSDYARVDGKEVNLYVAYYASQHQFRRSHSPLQCLPGSGWTIVGLTKELYPVASDLPSEINRMVVERDSGRELVYYWYDERGRILADEYWPRWYLLTDAITKNRTDGSLVRMATPILFGETEQQADDRLRSFMRVVLPSLAMYLPSDRQVSVNSALDPRNDVRP